MNKKNKFFPYIFISPAIFLVVIFFIVPVVIALFLSFTNMDLNGLADYGKIDFIGLTNYKEIFMDKEFLKAVSNTIFYLLVGVPTVIITSLTLAILINASYDKFASFIRGVFYMPSITNIVAVSVVFIYIYNPKFGLLNYLLGFIGIKPISWLFGGPIISKISLIILASWRAAGVSMIIFLAAIKGVSREFYEAAEIDGANKIQQLIKITLPLISYAIFFVSITTIIGWIQFFDEPLIMTQGKPLNETLSIALFIYNKGFKFNKFGYSATASLILLISIMIITIVQFQVKNRIEKD